MSFTLILFIVIRVTTGSDSHQSFVQQYNAMLDCTSYQTPFWCMLLYLSPHCTCPAPLIKTTPPSPHQLLYKQISGLLDLIQYLTHWAKLLKDVCLIYWSPEREDKSIIWNDSVYSIINQLLHSEHMNKLIVPGCYNLLGEDPSLMQRFIHR